jgi:CheY-like chemotaxis protein
MIRVLYVDDDHMLREVVRAVLQRQPGFSVTTAAGGAEALASARSGTFDLIVLDARMPGMDGPAVLTALRQDAATRQVPVAFLTGRADEETMLGLRMLGAVGVLAKPFKPSVLVEAVSTWAHADA